MDNPTNEQIKSAASDIFRSFAEGGDDPILSPAWHQYEQANGTIIIDQPELLELIEGAICFGIRSAELAAQIIEDEYCGKV